MQKNVLILLTLFVSSIVVADPAAAAPEKQGVRLGVVSEKPIGQRVVYHLREELARSARWEEKELGHWGIYVLTKEPENAFYTTVALTITRMRFVKLENGQPDAVEEFRTSQILLVGRSHAADAAILILTLLDQAAADVAAEAASE